MFTAADMIFKDYDTSGRYDADDQHVSGLPDETRLLRSDQQQVLYFINYCYKLWDWPVYSKAPGRKLEMLIRYYVAKDAVSQQDVFSWIVENWRHYWDLLPTKPVNK
jgi:hypothetical protein